MELSLKELSPWTDVFNILSQARSVQVTVDGNPAADTAELSIDDEHNVTLAVTAGTKRKKAKKTDYED